MKIFQYSFLLILTIGSYDMVGSAQSENIKITGITRSEAPNVEFDVTVETQDRKYILEYPSEYLEVVKNVPFDLKFTTAGLKEFSKRVIKDRQAAMRQQSAVAVPQQAQVAQYTSDQTQ